MTFTTRKKYGVTKKSDYTAVTEATTVNRSTR